jgi:hypothetical protein
LQQILNPTVLNQLMTLSWLLITSVFYAQSSGTITGLVTDQDFNNEPLAFANVLVEEAQTGVITDIDGKFTIEGLASGHYTLTISFVGYETQTIPNVAVEAGKSVNLQTSLQMSMADLEEVVIKTTTRRNSEVALLMDRKKAVGIQQTIGSDELSKKGVGDVSTAVNKKVLILSMYAVWEIGITQRPLTACLFLPTIRKRKI